MVWTLPLFQSTIGARLTQVRGWDGDSDVKECFRFLQVWCWNFIVAIISVGSLRLFWEGKLLWILFFDLCLMLKIQNEQGAFIFKRLPTQIGLRHRKLRGGTAHVILLEDSSLDIILTLDCRISFLRLALVLFKELVACYKFLILV